MPQFVKMVATMDELVQGFLPVIPQASGGLVAEEVQDMCLTTVSIMRSAGSSIR